jgi:tRNA(fMet)-specific endonuclease VapC
MNGKILLDTNIIIGLFANDKKVIEHLEDAAEIFVPAIVLGELFYGVFRSTNIEKNLERLSAFANNSNILMCNSETAEQYGIIKSYLKNKGKPIPENDIWIAAIAKQNEITLITRDEHFNFIENLPIKMW